MPRDFFFKPGLGFRAFIWTVIITTIITLNILLQFSDHVPSKVSTQNIWYTDKFNFTVPFDIPNAALWNPEYLNPAIDQYSVLDTHSHTTISDGSLTPEQLVDWAIAYGLNALFVTDHNDIEGGLLAQRYAQTERSNEIVIIPGVEYTCCRIHLNLIGINETISPSSSWPEDEELEWVISRTHELGGIALVAHIPWSTSTEYGRDRMPTLPAHPTRETLYKMGVDGFESVSEGILDLPTIRFSEENNLPLFSASDMHDPETAPVAWTVIKHSEKDLLDSTREELILDTFKQRKKTSFYFDPVGPSPRVFPEGNPQWNKFAPLLALDMTYFWTESKGMFSFVDGRFCHVYEFTFHYSRAIWTLVYILSAFLSVELVLLRRHNNYNRIIDDPLKKGIHLD